MDTTVKALQELYVALGGEASDVKNCVTIVDVLNAISEMYDGDSDAVLNPVAIANIAAVADSIGGSSDFSTATLTVVNNESDSHTVYFPITGTSASDTSFAVSAGETVTKEVILYNGNQGYAAFGQADGTVSLTGDISYSRGILTLTGNATLTFAGGEE